MAQSTKVSLVLEGKDNVSKTLEKTQKQLQATADKAQAIEAIGRKFKETEESSKSYGAKLKTIKKAMEELQQTGAITTDEGKRMWDEMSNAAKAYQKNLDDIKKATSNIEPPEVKGDMKLDFKSLGGNLADQAGLGGLTKSLGGLAAMANPATIAVAAVGGTMVAAGKKAADFEVHLDSLQALTGLTTEQMKGVSDTSLQMSKKFGMAAGEVADSMGLIGSQAPELLQNADALAFVTDAAMTLAKAGDIAAEDAGKAITTVINQMGAMPAEAMDIANALAAAEQQGSASIAYLNTAFEKAGTQAKGAGMSFTELAAMIEAVAPKFSSADVAGSQLNSTLLKLSMGADEFNPAVVGMQQALENLSNAQLSNEQLSKMVGESNITMVKTMIDAKDSFAGFSQTLAGTNAAVDSWQTKTDNMAGMIDRLKATWDAFLITLGQSGLIQGIADNIMNVMQALGEVIDIISEVIDAFDAFEGGVDNDVNLMTVQLDVLVEVIRGIGTALQVIIRIAAKVFNSLRDAALNAAEWIGSKWSELKQKLGDIAFVKVIVNAFNKVMDAAANAINTIKRLWNKLKEFLGMKTEGNVDVKVNHTDAEVASPTTVADGSTGGGGGNAGSRAGSGGGGKGKSSTPKTPKAETPKAEKIDYLVAVDDNTLEMAEKKLQAFTSKKKSIPIDDTEALAECDRNIQQWTDEVQRRKVALGLTPAIAEGSLAWIQKQIEEKNKEITLALQTDIDPESLAKLQSELDALRKREKDKKVELGIVSAVDNKRSTQQEGQQKINQIKSDYQLNLIGKEEAERQIAEVNAKLVEVGLTPIDLHVNDDGTITTAMEELDEYVSKMDDTAGQIGTLGSAFSTMGEAIGGTGGKVLEFAGQTIGAVAEIIPQIVSLIAAKQAEAMASGTASAAAMPFPSNIVAIASIIATITSLFASIPKAFATGGLVPGSSYHGDSVLVRANSGEMILNNSQQANLFRLLKNGNGNGQPGGNVEFKISGSSLKGVLRNYERQIDKLG